MRLIHFLHNRQGLFDALHKDTGAHWRILLKSDPCVYCGNPSENIDHIIPRANGGYSAWFNIAPES